MSSWEELLVRLADTPRENGSAALQQTAVFLREVLERAGAEVELVAFSAHPFALRLAGVIALAGGLLYLRLMRARRFRLALLAALALPALLLAELDYQQTLFGWIGARTQHHVVARLPAERAEQRLLFTAHYDTKTDVLDHVERAPVDLLAAPVSLLMIAGALAGWGAGRLPRFSKALRRLASTAAWSAAAYGGLSFVALSAGVFLPQRSPGALDDGGSCAVLVRLVERLAAQPAFARTDVEVVLFSAEEVGVQGSWVYANERFARPPALPTFVVNLEGIGASTRHGVLPSERFTLRSYAPDAGIVERLDSVHKARFGAPLERGPVGGATDARSFLAHGIPAATLFSRERGSRFPRGLHSARDERSRLDETVLDASLGYLHAVARSFESRGP